MCVCGGGGGGEATRKTNWISWIMYVYIRKKGAYVCEETFLLMVVIMLYNLVIVIYLFNKEMWKCFLAI
jgi:hypothetical protein